MKKAMAEADRIDALYGTVFDEVATIVDASRSYAARSVNATMTASYWLIRRSIVEFEQEGEQRAEYGSGLIERLWVDLTQRYRRGFSRQNIWLMRSFYLSYPPDLILQTASGESETTSVRLRLEHVLDIFPLPWSAYVRLLSVKNVNAREFYQAEALRGGWSVRQLDRQINSQFYERTALSRNKAAMLERGQKPIPEDAVLPEEAIKDPFVLEFLVKDEYSESDLEEALINHLETFLLELGDDFCFMGRQSECESATNGSGSICCFFTEVCGVSSLLT